MQVKSMVQHKILFVAHQSDLSGGASKSMIALILELRDRYQYDIMVLVPSRGALSDLLDQLNIRWLSGIYYWWMGVQNKKSPVSFIKWQIKKIINLVSASVLFFKLYPEKFDLIYSNTSTMDIGLTLSRFLFKPHVTHIREFGLDDYGIWFFEPINRVINRLSASSSHIITISKSLQEQYSELLPCKKINLVYNGIDDDFNLADSTFSHQDDIIRFVIVGYLCKGKGQQDIIEAARQLKISGHNSFHIYIAGSGEAKYISELTALISSYDLSHHITLVGEQDRGEIISLLSRCDVGLITSRKEAFGRVTVEYMLASLPVIASDSGANPELIDDGITGLLYVAGDCAALSEKMSIYMNDRTLAKTHGMRARDEALQRFSIERCAGDVHEIIIDVLSAK